MHPKQKKTKCSETSAFFGKDLRAAGHGVVVTRGWKKRKLAIETQQTDLKQKAKRAHPRPRCSELPNDCRARAADAFVQNTQQR